MLNKRFSAAVLATVVAVTIATPSLLAQWPAYPSGSIPKTADGKVDLNAPAPRTADGKPDLSGVWETAPCPNCAPPVIDGLSPPQAPARGTAPAAGAPAAGRGRGGPIRAVFANVGASLPDGVPPYQPWADELVKKRVADNSKDNPDAHCLPMGIMQLDSHPYPKKIIQTPTEVLLVYEAS